MGFYLDDDGDGDDGGLGCACQGNHLGVFGNLGKAPARKAPAPARSAAAFKQPSSRSPAIAAAKKAPAAVKQTAAQRARAAGQPIPTKGQRLRAAGQNVPTVGQRARAAGQNVPTVGQQARAAGLNVPTVGQRARAAGLNVPTLGQRMRASTAAATSRAAAAAAVPGAINENVNVEDVPGTPLMDAGGGDFDNAIPPGIAEAPQQMYAAPQPFYGDAGGGGDYGGELDYGAGVDDEMYDAVEPGGDDLYAAYESPEDLYPGAGDDDVAAELVNSYLYDIAAGDQFYLDDDAYLGHSGADTAAMGAGLGHSGADTAAMGVGFWSGLGHSGADTAAMGAGLGDMQSRCQTVNGHRRCPRFDLVASVGGGPQQLDVFGQGVEVEHIPTTVGGGLQGDYVVNDPMESLVGLGFLGASDIGDKIGKAGGVVSDIFNRAAGLFKPNTPAAAAATPAAAGKGIAIGTGVAIAAASAVGVYFLLARKGRRR